MGVIQLEEGNIPHSFHTTTIGFPSEGYCLDIEIPLCLSMTKSRQIWEHPSQAHSPGDVQQATWWKTGNTVDDNKVLLQRQRG